MVALDVLRDRNEPLVADATHRHEEKQIWLPWIWNPLDPSLMPRDDILKTARMEETRVGAGTSRQPSQGVELSPRRSHPHTVWTKSSSTRESLTPMNARYQGSLTAGRSLTLTMETGLG